MPRQVNWLVATWPNSHAGLSTCEVAVEAGVPVSHDGDVERDGTKLHYEVMNQVRPRPGRIGGE